MEENFFSKWVKETYFPTGIVFSTEKAKKIISKNNLTPSEFLRPFGIFKEVFFSPNDKYEKIIKNFRMDFYDSYSYKKANQEILQKITDNLLLNQTIYPEWSLSETISNKFLDSIQSKLKDYSYPWFNEYQSLFFEFLRFNEYEIYQQPFIYIYICALDDPLDIVIPKENKNTVPPLIYEGVYFRKMPMLVLILLDMSENDNQLSQDKKNYYFIEFKKKFKDYFLLYWEINLNDPIENPINDDIWKNYIHKIDYYSQKDYPNIIRGEYISKRERIKFKETFLDFMNNYVILILTDIVNTIDNDLQNTRRGLKNTFLSMLRRNDKTYYNNFFHIYSLTLSEKNEYLLAIIQFYFQNYESAYESLQFFMSDVKSKSLIHYCAAYELSAICYYILHPYDREIDIEDIYQKYLKYGQYNQALRTLIILIKVNEQKRQFQSLTKTMMSAVNEIPHSQTKNEKNQFLPHNRIISRISPLLFEKMSTYFLLPQFQKIRKYIFYIILSGNYYKNEQNDYQRYCLNAYSTIFRFIDSKTASFIRIKEEINRQIGIICKDMQYYEGGLKFFKNCVELEQFSKNKQMKPTQYENMIKCLDEVIKCQNNGTVLSSYNVNDLKIPEIDNRSLLIIEEQDYQIAELKNSIGNWMLFKEFTRVPMKRIYLSLTHGDIISIRNLDNILQKKQNFSNFYSKRNFRCNVNNKMYVRFAIKNPLSYNLNITNISLICDFTSGNDLYNNNNAIEYQRVKFILEPKQTKEIELFCKPLIQGHCIIKGVEITLDNIALVKHFFNKKNYNQLYRYRTKRSKSSQCEKVNTPSNKGGFKKLSNYVQKLNLKADITFDIIDNNADLVIDFPMGKEINAYKNQLILMPIKITNNSPAKINKFCLFFLEKDNDDELNQSLLCKYIYKEIDLFIDKKNEGKGQKEVIVYVPIIPKKEGEIYIKIIVKYEEEIKFKDNECKRFIVKFNVKSSVEFEIKENILIFANERENNKNIKITNFYLDLISFIKNKEYLTNLNIEKYVLMGNNFIRQDIEDFGWEQLGKEEGYEKYYHRFKFIKKAKYKFNSMSSFFGTLRVQNNNKKRIVEINELEKKLNFDFLPDYINNDPLQSHIKNKLAQSILDNKILFIWSCKDYINNILKGVYYYQTSLKTPKSDAKFIKELMKNITTINVNKSAIDDQRTLIQINFEFDIKSLLELHYILYYVIFINDNGGNLQWLGLKKYKVDNIKKDDINKINLVFSCICSDKGKVDINKIAMRLFIKDSNEPPLLLTNIPYPIIISI